MFDKIARIILFLFAWFVSEALLKSIQLSGAWECSWVLDMVSFFVIWLLLCVAYSVLCPIVVLYVYRLRCDIQVPKPNASINSLSVLISLFEIRKREIASAYITIRFFQGHTASGSHWVESYLKNIAIGCSFYRPDLSTREWARREAFGSRLFRERFESFDRLSIDLGTARHEVMDLFISLLSWEAGCDEDGVLYVMESFCVDDQVLRSLASLKLSGLYKLHINTLMCCYPAMSSRSVKKVFSRFRAPWRRLAYDTMLMSWSKLLALTECLIELELNKSRSDFAREDLIKLSKEIEALREMAHWLPMTMAQGGTTKTGLGLPTPESENLIISSMRKLGDS